MASASTIRGSADPVITAGDLNLTQQYVSVRQTSLRCCAPLTVEDHSLQSMPDASPAKWHLAHTTWFFETFLLTEHLPDYPVFRPAFRNLFNSYYNAVGDRPPRALRHTLSRPALEEVRAYRSHVDEAMTRLLSRELAPEVLDLVTLGLNHEQQHQELILTDVKNGLALNPLRPAYREVGNNGTNSPGSATELRWRSFPEGIYTVGFEGSDFAFDNESPRHNVYLAPFRLASRPVTNGEYIQFMLDNGYSTAALWLSDGWDCVRANQWSAPLYWEMRDGRWWHYTMDGMRPVGEAEPACHVSFYEADAFARWAGERLPTEFEWEVASRSCAIEGNFVDSGAFHPQPASESGALTQMFGDVWEWTASAYLPYPGFQAAAGAVGEYNGKFMCNQMVLRGGSCATPRSHIRRSYRNFFPPHARWQFMGIRLANGD
ncbi:MAG TPA: ergothioneine biosynthesis protein EgtB [Candidatus Limnocylindrales bacterium]|jgi:ergothioneine biosynthesis protein EgtB|nr:ergothioneine biosynthesis protein EgtB [Candidatus Limnocylindrales bacterium]